MSKWLRRGAALIIFAAVYLTPPEMSFRYFAGLAISLVLTGWILYDAGVAAFFIHAITFAIGLLLVGFSYISNPQALIYANILLALSSLLLVYSNFPRPPLPTRVAIKLERIGNSHRSLISILKKLMSIMIIGFLIGLSLIVYQTMKFHFWYIYPWTFLGSIMAWLALRIEWGKYSWPIRNLSGLTYLMIGVFTFLSFFGYYPDGEANWITDLANIFILGGFFVTTYSMFEPFRKPWVIKVAYPVFFVAALGLTIGLLIVNGLAASVFGHKMFWSAYFLIAGILYWILYLVELPEPSEGEQNGL